MSCWPLEAVQQQELVAVTIRGSDLFLSVAVWMPVFIMSPSSRTYTESIRSKQEHYSAFEKYAAIIFDIEKIHKIIARIPFL